MKLSLTALAASVMLLAISCKRNADTSAKDATITTQAMIEYEAPPGNNKEEDKDGQPNRNNQVPVKYADNDWDKKIVKTAVLNVETEDFKKYNTQVHELATKWEGYIAREEESGSEYKVNNLVTIKVPVSRFDEAVNTISSLKGKMLVKQISSEDVTAEVMDIRTRAEAKKRIRIRYLDMLQKAKNIEEIIQVEHEINQVQEQIEAAEGRLNYLMHTTSYSTIELTFFQVLDPKAVNDANPGYARRLLTALNEGLKWVGNLVIFFATLWPLWLITAIIILTIRRIRLVTIKVKSN